MFCDFLTPSAIPPHGRLSDARLSCHGQRASPALLVLPSLHHSTKTHRPIRPSRRCSPVFRLSLAAARHTRTSSSSLRPTSALALPASHPAPGRDHRWQPPGINLRAPCRPRPDDSTHTSSCCGGTSNIFDKIRLPLLSLERPLHNILFRKSPSYLSRLPNVRPSFPLATRRQTCAKV